MIRSLLLLVLAALPFWGEDVRYFIPADPAPRVSAKTRAAITKAICDGKAEGTACDTCPGGSIAGVGFSLKRVLPGHFLAPTSEDAFVSISGCEQMHATIGWGFLVTKRDGGWESGQDVLGLDLNHCRRMRFRSGRELLVCEDYRMDQFVLMHEVTAIFMNGETISFHNLVTASDSTEGCYEQSRVEKGRIDGIEFRDLNGDGIEDIAITASYGTMPDSKRRQRLCEAAENRKSGVRRPEPTALKPYRIEYLFDGRRFILTKGSDAFPGFRETP